jgi:hypothetical protein
LINDKTILLYMGGNYCIIYGRLTQEFPLHLETKCSIFERS